MGPRGLPEQISLLDDTAEPLINPAEATSGLPGMNELTRPPYCLNHFHSSSESMTLSPTHLAPSYRASLQQQAGAITHSENGKREATSQLILFY